MWDLNKTIKLFFKNIFYTIFTNILSLLISTFVTLVIPKFLGVEEYGYWQLYLFYSTYVGLLHFGWNDGIYLRYGGSEYNKLDKKIFFTQYITLLILQILLALIIVGSISIYIEDSNKRFIIKMTMVSMVIVNTRIMYIYILQATSRIKEYTRVMMLDRISYIIFIILFFLLNIKNYKSIILADILGKTFSFVYVIFICRDIAFNKFIELKDSLKETFLNIRVGIRLMLANFASMLIIGIVRFGIEKQWDIQTFGEISLTLSISNMIMIFINAIGIVIFPMLRRENKENLKNVYFLLREILMIIFLGLLFSYYPLKYLINIWLPKYQESILYMSLIFPIYIYEGKTALLVNTYLKVLRKEKKLLKINIILLAISLLLTSFTVFFLKNLNIVVFSILIILILKSSLAELILSKELRANFKKDLVMEIFLTILFVIINWKLEIKTSIIIYGCCYSIYLLIKRKELENIFKLAKINFNKS